MAKLDQLGLRENTVVIFTSDNGGLSTGEGWPTSNFPLRTGKGWIYEGGLRVPLIVRWPGTVAPRAIVNAPVCGPDFFPTLAEIAGVSSGPQTIDGVSLVPLLRGERPRTERALFWHFPHYGNQGCAPGSVVREGDWKLLEWHEDERRELYNLRDDESEANDLAASRPELVAALTAKLAAWREDLGALMPAPNESYDPTKPDGRLAPRPRVAAGQTTKQ